MHISIDERNVDILKSKIYILLYCAEDFPGPMSPSGCL